MQLKFAFLEQTEIEKPDLNRWEQFDPAARDGATAILSRLIAQMLRTTTSAEDGDE